MGYGRGDNGRKIQITWRSGASDHIEGFQYLEGKPRTGDALGIAMVDGLSFCTLHCLCHLCKSARPKQDSIAMLDRTESTGGLRLYAWVLQAVKDASDCLSTVGKSNLNSVHAASSRAF